MNISQDRITCRITSFAGSFHSQYRLQFANRVSCELCRDDTASLFRDFSLSETVLRLLRFLKE
jgi:hypothetical protein